MMFLCCLPETEKLLETIQRAVNLTLEAPAGGLQGYNTARAAVYKAHTEIEHLIAPFYLFVDFHRELFIHHKIFRDYSLKMDSIDWRQITEALIRLIEKYAKQLFLDHLPGTANLQRSISQLSKVLKNATIENHKTLCWSIKWVLDNIDDYISLFDPEPADITPTSNEAPKETATLAGSDSNNEFEFLTGQVLYNGKDLRIGGPLKREVFKTLHSNKGRVVSRETLSEITAKFGHYIGQINTLLEAENIPFYIYTITGEGYKLDKIERS